MKTKNRQQIVVIGGGFAGMNIVKHLNSKIYDVILIDKNNFHAFPPLFYQIASSGLEPGSICFPFRQEFRKHPHVHFWMGELISINADAHIVKTSTGNIGYDYLIIATGATTNFFGNNQLEKWVYTLKSTSDAIGLRNQVLSRLEYASTCFDETKRKAMLCFVVIGGGPTGVEVAGALGEMKKFILPREYPDIDIDDVRVILAEGSDRLLRTMSKHSSEKAQTYLQQLDVEVLLNKILSSYDGKNAIFSDSEILTSQTVVWTAGIIGEKIKGIPDEVFNRQGRLITNDYNLVNGFNDIFAIGDICCITSKEYPNGHPQVAQVAIQQAHNVAYNLNKLHHHRPFVYNDKGSMATIGRNRAVVDLPYSHFQGRLAWMIWMFVHLLSMLGMKNKLITFINWVWNYFTYNTSLRLYIRPPKHPDEKSDE